MPFLVPYVDSKRFLGGRDKAENIHFLSKTLYELDNYNLHCIQLADTLLRTSPWVETKVWGDKIGQKK
jgi:hypothetical protein